MYKVFVYGTLLTNESNWSRFLAPEKGREAKLTGFELHDAGFYPMMIPSNDEKSVVWGEVFEIDEGTLISLDILEGYSAKYPDRSFFRRITVTLDDGTIAYTYICQDGENLPLIGSGDWRLYSRRP